MKCPKCGSKDIYWQGIDDGDYEEWWYCNKCDYDLTREMEEYNDKLYLQQRLDKVLSKFTKSKYEKMIQIDLCIIVYENNKFHLGTWYDGLELEISLDTVESLLKDLKL